MDTEHTEVHTFVRLSLYEMNRRDKFPEIESISVIVRVLGGGENKQ